MVSDTKNIIKKAVRKGVKKEKLQYSKEKQNMSTKNPNIMTNPFSTY